MRGLRLGLPHRANSSHASTVVEEGHEGKRRTESLWPVHQINWQRTRYIYDLYYKYGKISRELYDYCLQEVRSRRVSDAFRRARHGELTLLRRSPPSGTRAQKIADKKLISWWKKVLPPPAPRGPVHDAHRRRPAARVRAPLLDVRD